MILSLLSAGLRRFCGTAGPRSGLWDWPLLFRSPRRCWCWGSGRDRSGPPPISGGEKITSSGMNAIAMGGLACFAIVLLASARVGPAQVAPDAAGSRWVLRLDGGGAEARKGQWLHDVQPLSGPNRSRRNGVAALPMVATLSGPPAEAGLRSSICSDGGAGFRFRTNSLLSESAQDGSTAS